MIDQLFLCINGIEFSPDKVETKIRENDIFRKGGLWTSSFTPNKGSSWMRGGKFPKDYAHCYTGFLFEVKEGAKVYEVNSPETENYFNTFYSGKCEILAHDYDGLHLDYSYVEGIKRRHEFTHFLSWSTESTWWFNIDYLSLKEVIDSKEIVRLVHE